MLVFKEEENMNKILCLDWRGVQLDHNYVRTMEFEKTMKTATDG